MPITTAAKSVTTSATLLSTADGGSWADPVPVEIFNNAGATVVYVGGESVTTASGIPVAPQTASSFALMSGDNLYGVVTAATAEVRVMRGRS